VTVGGTRPFKNFIKIITESCYNSKIENARNFTSLRKRTAEKGKGTTEGERRTWRGIQNSVG